MKWWLVLRSEVCKLGALTSSLPTGVHLHPGLAKPGTDRSAQVHGASHR